MRLKTIRAVVAVLAVMSGGFIGTAQAANYVIGGAQGSTLAPTSGSWAWDGQYIAGYRGALGNSAYFGAGGTVNQAITTTTLSSITAGTLGGLNAFIAPWWYNGESAPYNALITNFFLAGGNLFLLDDSSAQNGLAASLGIPTHDVSDGSVSNGPAPLYIGPFGTPANVTQNAQHGFLVLSEITAHGGFACSTNASGQITAACFNPGAYAAGAGAMVITSDVDMISTPDGGGSAVYGPLSANAKFALNATAFLMGKSAVTAPPVSAPTLSEWGLIGLAVLLIASATLAIARNGARDAAV